MNGPVRNRRHRFFLVLAPLLLGSVAIPATGSGAEEQKKVSSTTVAEGLKTIQTASAEIAKHAAEDKAAAEKAVGVIAPVWSMIEGTIQANSQESYAALENALEALSAAAEAGDAKNAGGAAGAFASAVNFYNAKFPAEKAAAAAEKPAEPAGRPAPAAATERKAASTEPAATGAAADSPAAAPSGTLARTGPASGLTALAGLALGFGGLAVIGGARRRP